MIFLGSVFEVEVNHQEDMLNFEDRSASRQFSVLRGSVQKGNVFLVVGEGNYRKEPDSYFEARTLNKIKGSHHLWGLAISTISCGIFESWNIYLDGQGWGSLLVSTVVVFIMYLCLTSCISELSCALPQTGGAYSFARTALGSTGGFITGLTQTIEFVLGVSLSGLFVAINANKILLELTNGKTSLNLSLWLSLSYIFNVILNFGGISVSLNFCFLGAIVSISSLLILFFSAFIVGKFSWNNIFKVKDNDQNISTDFFPNGTSEIFTLLPSSVIFFIGMEDISLIAEEIDRATQIIPSTLRSSTLTAGCMALIVLIIVPGVASMINLGELENPILQALNIIFPFKESQILFSCLSFAVNLASFNGFIFAASRNIYALSRAGYYPRFVSLTSTVNGAPYVAIILSTLLAYLLAMIPTIFLGLPEINLIKYMLLMCIFAAVLTYILQMLSYMILKWCKPNIPRPYNAPYGIFASGYALVIAFTISLVVVQDEESHKPFIFLGVFYLLTVLSYCIFSKKGLVLSPEEIAALRYRTEGYLSRYSDTDEI